MKSHLIGVFFLEFMFCSLAFAERGLDVDVNGFVEASSKMIINVGNQISAAAIILTAIGLMIPGFRETTRRSLPWVILGIVGIIIATRYWR